MRLTTNFCTEEFETSQYATRWGIDNRVPAHLMPNLRKLAHTMQGIRDFLGRPVTITSGYRSPEVNTAIGGAKKSDHMLAAAADFICPGFGSPYEVAMALREHMEQFSIRQLIHEYGRWIHIGILPVESSINRVLTISQAGTQSGIVKV